MNNKAVVTIISKNYMAFATVLRDSVLLNNPDVDFYTFIIDEDNPYKDTERSEVIVPSDVKIEHFYQRALYFDITELSTSVKPDVLLYLLDKGYSSVIYLDPDIKVYSSLDSIYERLIEDYDFVLTPHILSPINDDNFPSEIDMLKTGIYNLGFIGCGKGGKSIIKWWSDRLEKLGFNDTGNGLFTDQKWIDLLPALSARVYIDRNEGLNVAYWNLHERRIRESGEKLFVNNSPLIFFHFSGIDVRNIDNISKYQNRFKLSARKDIERVFEDYALNVSSSTTEYYSSYRYKYSFLFDRYVVSEFTRRLYKRFLEINPRKIYDNPFTDNSRDSFVAWLLKNQLAEKKIQKHVWEEEKILYKAEDLLKTTYKSQFNLVSRVFRALRRLLGDKKYSDFLKVLSIISNTRRGVIIYDEDFKTK